MATIDIKTAKGGTVGPTPTAPTDTPAKDMSARVPTTTPATPVAAQAAAPAATPTAPTTLQDMYQQRMNDSAARIGGLYDKQLESQKLALQNAYQQNLSDQEAARAGISGNYRTAANDLAVQYERNRRNLNEQALARGLNTGAASQQQLALNQGWMRNYGTLRGQEAQALTEADRQITNLKNNYQNNIAQAIADNDYKKAAALLDDYNNQQNWMEKQAALLADYGNFEPYAGIYGQDTANQMQQMWAVQNPQAAWALGLIDAATYRKVTGKNPPGTKKSGSGASYGGPAANPDGVTPDGETPATGPNLTITNKDIGDAIGNGLYDLISTGIGLIH